MPLNQDKGTHFVVAPTVIMEFIGSGENEQLQLAL